MLDTPNAQPIKPQQLDLRPGDPVAIAISPKQWAIVTIADLQNSGLVCLGLNGTWKWDRIGPPF